MIGERLKQLEVVLIERAEVVESVGDGEDAEQLIVRRHGRDDRVPDPPVPEEAPERLVADRPRKKDRLALGYHASPDALRGIQGTGSNAISSSPGPT